MCVCVGERGGGGDSWVVRPVEVEEVCVGVCVCG